jgi:hypothetical protein
MSWRDRLARKNPANHADTASQTTQPIGTIGTVGNETLSTTTDPADAVNRPAEANGIIGTIGNETLSASSQADTKKKDGFDFDPSQEAVRDSLAISADSAKRAGALDPISRPGGAVSADRVNKPSGHREIWGDAEEERAAIVEYDGGVPRQWAKGFAQLDPDRSPFGVPSKRWRTFVDDVGRFLDGDFAAVAAALGWGPYDLFGADRDRPLPGSIRPGCCGC